MAKREQLDQMLAIYGFPSQAYWRSFEMDVLQSVRFERPILEVGCSNGGFTKATCGFVETAIDINPRSLRLAARSGVFREVRLQDAATLAANGEFRTILFNSVIEHIPNPGPLLGSCVRALQPGGNIVLTVPLVDMNKYLLFSSTRWIEFRRRRLAHVNLLALEQWKELLEAAGARVMNTRRYLAPSQMKLWDTLDAVAMLGTSRFNIGSIAYKLNELAPAFLKRLAHRLVSKLLESQLRENAWENGCAALIVAQKV